MPFEPSVKLNSLYLYIIYFSLVQLNDIDDYIFKNFHLSNTNNLGSGIVHAG